MGENKIVILITAGLLLLTAVFFYTVKGEAETYRATISQEVQVGQTWELPKALAEVSGIAFIDDNKVAAVQDEEGIVYIYNLSTSQLEKEIPFAEKGDYEAIALNEGNAFVLRADGTIFKITDLLGAANTQSFATQFTAENDMEGLYFDRERAQLLVSVKEEGLKPGNSKGIYAINPATMKVDPQPVFEVDPKDPIFDKIRNKKGKAEFFPSEVSRDPSTGNILVLEAREPRLLILGPDGKPQALHRLDRKVFPQPEGISFDPSGNLYISNEGEPGTIHRVNINQK